MQFSQGSKIQQAAAKGAENKSGSSILLLVGILFLVIILGGGGYYLYSSDFFGSGEEEFDDTRPKVPPSQNNASTVSEKGVRQREKIPGVKVGKITIPSRVDEEAIEFLEDLESKGKFPIEVGSTGKDNPFLK